jgi:GntR family transcriptional regulator
MSMMSSRRLVDIAIDHRSRLPKYLQLKASLLREIRRARLPEGTRLPSEQTLVATVGCSKMTVRQAIAELVREGVVRRDHGRGTFVAAPRAHRRFWTMISFTEEMRSRGVEVENRLLEVRRVRPSATVRAALRLRADEPVLRIRRIRAIHGRPIAYHVSHIPLARCPDLAKADLEADSLYRIVERRYGYRFVRSDRTFRTGTPKPLEARLLGISVLDPVLITEGTTYVDDDVPIDWCHEVYRE